MRGPDLPYSAMHAVPIVRLCVALGLALGCGEGGGAPSSAPKEPEAARPAVTPPAPPKPALTDGAAVFRLRCATCHGESGDGHGPASAGLDPQPRDFRDPTWQDSVSDQHVESVIALGGAAVGLSPIMPPHPDLAAQPGELAALRAFIRNLRR